MPVRFLSFTAALVAFVATAPVYAQQNNGLRLPRDKMNVQATKPTRPRASNPCAQYGPGFARVDGTDTCIKIGGSISIGGGINSNAISR